jgi:hypothetical protein
MGQARLGGGKMARWARKPIESGEKEKKKKRARLQKGNKLNWLGPPEENRKVFSNFGSEIWIQFK